MPQKPLLIVLVISSLLLLLGLTSIQMIPLDFSNSNSGTAPAIVLFHVWILEFLGMTLVIFIAGLVAYWRTNTLLHRISELEESPSNL